MISNRTALIGLVCWASCIAPVVWAEPGSPTALFLAPNRQFSRRVVTWQAVRSQYVVMQNKEYTCGAASVATIMRHYHEDDITEGEVLTAALDPLSKEEVLDRQENGLSMEDLSRAASRLKYSAATLEVKFEKLRALPMPVVVRLVKDDFKHFVVFRGEVGGRVFVADPLRGNVRFPTHRFLDEWDEKLLAVVKPGEKPRKTHNLQVSPLQPLTPEVQAARRAVLRDLFHVVPIH